MFCATCANYAQFKYEKDTIVNNVVAKKINVSSITLGYLGPNSREVVPLPSEYMYVSGDSLYLWNVSEYLFMYKFNLNIGDTLVLNNARSSCPDDINYPQKDTITITSTYLDTVDNRVFEIYQTQSKWLNTTAIINNIGCFPGFLPEINRSRCDFSSSSYLGNSFFEGLVCYSDDIRGDVNFNLSSSSDCHAIKTSIPDLKTNSSITLYPNPSSGVFKIDISNDFIKQVSVHNLLGEKIYDDYSGNYSLNLNHLASGIYLIEIFGASNQLYKQKVSIK
jgi:hypothetical protein